MPSDFLGLAFKAPMCYFGACVQNAHGVTEFKMGTLFSAFDYF